MFDNIHVLCIAGGMTTSLGFPFTNTQWKELERQAMIYKYMVASLPVPRDLLFPSTRAPSGPTISQSPCNHLSLCFCSQFVFIKLTPTQKSLFLSS